MILETEILFTDELAETLNRDPEYVWGKFIIDLREIIAVGEFMDRNELQPGLSEITIRGGVCRTIKTPYPTLKKLWLKANPEIKMVLMN